MFEYRISKTNLEITVWLSLESRFSLQEWRLKRFSEQFQRYLNHIKL
jgi:hypothetical protein